MDPSSLPPYVLELVAEAIRVSGSDFMVGERKSPGFDSELTLARHGAPQHTLLYTPQYRCHAVHFLVNASYKIIRLWSAPEARRKMPARSGSHLPRQVHEELLRKTGFPPGPHADGLSRFLYHGLVRQLTSFPADLAMERLIHNDLPEHRGLQHRYLEQQVRDFAPHFERDLERYVPSVISRASEAMNVAYAETVAALIGNPSSGPARTSKQHDLGERLRQQMTTLDPRDHEGDRVLIDTWAADLGLRSWYTWESLS